MSRWRSSAAPGQPFLEGSCSGAHDGRRAFVVALDNDPAGLRGRQKAREETLDWAGFKLLSDCPKRKDWNDDLIALKDRIGAPKVREIASLRL